MTQARVQFAQIGGFQPLIDYRKSGTVGVLEGRNFAWDSIGVQSAFASRLVATNEVIGDGANVAYELRISDYYHIVVGSEVWRLDPLGPGSSIGNWNNIATLTNVQEATLADVPEYFRGFTSFFMSGKSYINSWNHGTYEVDPADDSYTRLTSGTVPGFPTDDEPVVAICETNGRHCLMTETAFYWSGPNDPTDFVPAVGGAGFQIIGEHVGGQPRALTPIATGAIIWTTQGALVAEFIAGDAVFRFYELSSDVLPVSQSATVRLPTNAYLVLTRLGLFSVVLAQTPEPVTPLFNEFLREYMRERRLEVAHLWYTQADNRLFVSFKTDTGQFFETYTLDIALDRWGVFNELHLGMFHYLPERSPFAFMHTSGIVSYFLPSRNPNKNRENPSAPGTFRALGSWVTIGHIRAENMVGVGDAVQELNEVVVYRQLPIIGFDDTFFDEGYIDFIAMATTFDEGIITDPVTSEFDEGRLSLTIPSDAYRLELLSDLFSQDEGISGNLASVDMYRAKSNAFSDTWTGGLPAYYARLRFSANIDGQYFRLNAMDCTLTSAGQMI